MMKRIYLSVPHMGGNEQNFIREAFDTNWLTSVGANLNGFEEDFQRRIGLHGAAVSSGTAALHLGLRILGVGPGDTVLCSTLTFVATCNPIRYQGAEPIFLDSDYATWNLDPNLLEDALRDLAAKNRLPRALCVVHLYGQCADMDPILALCNQYEIAIIEDTAEALGTLYKGKPAGTFGDAAMFSFNGNKIITTTGGGMFASRNREWVEKVRFWSQQARDPGIAYEHSEMGYNYRMSNVLAGIGRGQFQVLDQRIAQRRAVAFRYRDAFSDLPGISIMSQADYGFHTNWLSVFLLDEPIFGATRDAIIEILARENIEARPVWKPMHLQPLFAGATCYGGSVAEDLFRRGICLPSSSSLSEEDQLLVINTIREAVGAKPLSSIPETATGELATA